MGVKKDNKIRIIVFLTLFLSFSIAGFSVFFENKNSPSPIIYAANNTAQTVSCPNAAKQCETAQDKAGCENAICIAEGVAEYILNVKNALGSNYTDRRNVVFLSPIHNLSDPRTGIFRQCLDEALAKGGGFQFDKQAGNAYNIYTGEGGMEPVLTIEAQAGSVDVLTETGFYPPDGTGFQWNREDAVNDLAHSLQSISGKPALLFNVFGTNPDSNFRGHVLDGGEIKRVCGDSCGHIGANLAVWTSDPNIGSEITKASNFKMGYILAIADANALNFVNAVPRNMIPILRLGVGGDSGGYEEPGNLAGLISQLKNTGKEVWISIGPNEPLSECWASPKCGCALSSHEAEAEAEKISWDWPDNPLSFYIPEEGNEELGGMANSDPNENIGQDPIETPGEYPPLDPSLPPPSTPRGPSLCVNSSTGKVLDVPYMLQHDPSWRQSVLDNCYCGHQQYSSVCDNTGCKGKVGAKSDCSVLGGDDINTCTCDLQSGCGCGPTSLAKILRFFNIQNNISNPGFIAKNCQFGGSFCSYCCGSYISYLVSWAKKENYISSFVRLGGLKTQEAKEMVKEHIDNNHLIIVRCTAYNWSWRHISVIAGYSGDRLPECFYFQDSIQGPIYYNADSVINSFDCTDAYALIP
jgi:hypothetical protein